MNLEDINFPLINATLNGLAGVLLVCGYVAIRRGRIILHRNLMLATFAVSTVFLASYLTYHYTAGHTKFAGPTGAAYFYYVLLISHIILAVAVPPLAIASLTLGLLDRRATHRKIAKITFPIWLYVSVTGVMVYVMLYHLYPSPQVPLIM